jgi:hypothetical protein
MCPFTPWNCSEDLRPGLRIVVVANYPIRCYPLSDAIEGVGVALAARHIEWLFHRGDQ